MAKDHPHAEATYRVLTQKDGAYGVEVLIPGSYPALITSFATEQKAEAWISEHKRRVAEGVFYRLGGRLYGKPSMRGQQ